MSKSVILGTAGHIDHGKSTLVKALTGIDPDRLKEEKERGITIDLGFANLIYPEDDLVVGIVDVPGHERLIKNMLAGAGGIDILLMVIAADEGIMPQSREHLAICNMLKIKTGIIALTKIDIVEPDWVGLVKDDIRDFVKGTFLEGVEVIPVSVKTGAGIDHLKDLIRQKALSVKPKLTNSIFRLPIDRVFTLKGFGTVVTGTALSGEAVIDMPVEILPSGLKSKIRGLQSHGRATDRAYAGQRVGINLQGVEKEQLKRGDVVGVPGRFMATRTIEASLEMLRDAPLLKDSSLVHLYCGTAETTARVILYNRKEVGPSEICYCQFRLQDEIVALSGDRYIIRRFSPLETIGGGTILDPLPERRRRREDVEDLHALDRGTILEKIETKVRKRALLGTTLNFIEGWLYGDLKDIKGALEELQRGKKIYHFNGTYYHAQLIDAVREDIKGLLKQFHKDNPLRPGMPKEELRSRIALALKTPVNDSAFELLIKDSGLAVDQDILRLTEFRAALSSISSEIKDKMLSILEESGFAPPLRPELQQMIGLQEREFNDLLRLMAKEGLIVKINDSIYITKKRYEELIATLRETFSKKPELTVAELRDILKTSRKYALPLMEYLDSQRVTIRVGDVRKFMLK